jgi:hypothetical protein
MLKATPRNTGAAGIGINQYNKEVQYQNSTAPIPPTYAELGLDKKTAKLDKVKVIEAHATPGNTLP